MTSANLPAPSHTGGGDTSSPDTSSMSLAFRDWFGLSRVEADVLSALYQAGGAPLDVAGIARRTGSTPSAVSVHIVQVRRALDGESVNFLPRAGYAMTASALAECREAILTTADALRASA